MDNEGARALARVLHAGQCDRLGAPYVEHVKRVGKLLDACGCTEVTVVAGFLHDTIEDTAATVDDLAAMCGRQVAETVDAVTRREGETYEGLIARASAHELGAMVKLADVLDHLDVRFAAGLTESLHDRYLAAVPVLLDALGRTLAGELGGARQRLMQRTDQVLAKLGEV